MAHIACNSKNSFALDKKGNLYTWGSCETGLLGQINDSDQLTPMEVKVQNGYDEYFVEQINAGQFHVGVIAKRIDCLQTPLQDLVIELKDVKELFKKVTDWFIENIRINSPQEFICLLLRKRMGEHIKYEEFENLFLEPFFAYLELYKRDFFHMKETYKEYLSEEEMFGITRQNPTFQVSDLDKLTESKNPKIKDLYDFAVKCSKYFQDQPEDFQFFACLIFRFKPYINDQEIKRLFEYSEVIREDSGLLEKIAKIVNVLNIQDKLKSMPEKEKEKKKNLPKINFNEKLVEANVLIDCMLERQTGLGKLFTWGVHAEGRLGYKVIDETINTKEDEVQIQRIPKLVYFRDNVRIKSVSCGFLHTLALTENGNVYAWGTSKYGCLGRYLSENQETPILIEYDIDNQKFTKIIQVAAGMYMSLALDSQGRVFSWGLGNHGRLGHGDENSVERPKSIQYFIDNDIKIKQISCGDLHCAGISTVKELFTWGNGSYGKLGHCNFDNMLVPTQVGFFAMSKVENVICGSYNTIAITTDSKVYAWGKNSHGMLGIPHMQEVNILVPTEILYQKDDPSLIVSEIALGSMHQLFLCANGALYSCGNSVDGILGIENVYDKNPYLLKIKSNVFYEKHNKNIMEKTDFFKDYSSDFTLNRPATKLPNAVVYVDCSSFNTAFLTNTGELYMSGQKGLIPESEKTGENKANIIDNSNIKDRYVTQITFFREKVYYISLGKYHAICIADGKAYSWGMNYNGVCGLSGKSNNERIAVPTLIESIKTNIKMSCVSDLHSLVLTTNGEIYAFGDNMYGKLGIGDINKYFRIGAAPMEFEPILVRNITSAHYISCSNSHSACIMKYDQDLNDSYSVYTWGSGFNGKLGHMGGQDSYEPRVVEELSSKTKEGENRKLFFIKVALGEEFTLALDETGQLWGWGKKKYLPGISGDPEGKAENPVSLLDKKKFKFIVAKGNLACAISDGGELYSWGEMIVEDNITKFEFGEVSSEKMCLASIGFNHCASIDSSYQPYTWGSNLYAKCGYEPKRDENVEVITLPKRIEAFYEQFNANDEAMKAENREIRLEEKNTKMDSNSTPKQESKTKEEEVPDKNKLNNEKANREGRDETQLKLLDEPVENKSLGLMIKDIKVNKNFFEVTRSFMKQLQIVEESKVKLYLDTEDKIISLINKSECKINKEYKSEVPLILAKNFQMYEGFIQLINIHPCYLKKIYDIVPNYKNFMDILSIIYGKNEILLKNRRTISNLLGLWNSIFDKFDFQSIDYNCSDTILYYIYELLFKISEENVRIANEMIAFIFLQLISKTLENEFINLEKNAENVAIKFKSLKSDIKTKIKQKCREILTKYLADIFSDINDKSNYSYSTLWILSRFVNHFQNEEKQQMQTSSSESSETLNKILNNFIFQPCQRIIQVIIDSHETNLPAEFFQLKQSISDTLLKPGSKKMFVQLYNDYKVKREVIDNNVFKVLCMPKSDILKEILEIFKELSNSSKEIPKIIQNFRKFEFDFSINAVKETCKLMSEKGNEQVTIPMTISDLILLQTSFEKVSKDLDVKDPLRNFLNELSDCSISELGSNSTINNTVINITFNPYEFYYRNDQEVDMIKCEKCLLPIPDILLRESQKEACLKGLNWICNNKISGNDKKCGFENEGEAIECIKCGKIKEKDQIINNAFYFNRYYITNADELALLLEKTLYILPSLYKHDDILKEVNIMLNNLRDSKDKSKEKLKIDTLEKFKAKLISYKEDSKRALGNEKEILAKAKVKIEENYQSRLNHVKYLKKIEESINFIEQLVENAKVSYSFYEKKIASFSANVTKGYVSQYFTQFNRILPKINRNLKLKPRVLSRVFLVKDLIEKKVIQEILFDKKEEPKLVQKSYIEFEKKDDGYKMILSYKEKHRKYLVCGTVKHDCQLKQLEITKKQILELRRMARHNPVMEFGDISFNSFYLVVLLNTLTD